MEKMKPEEVMAILKECGKVISIEEAEQILEFVYKMAEISIAQCLRERNEGATERIVSTPFNITG